MIALLTLLALAAPEISCDPEHPTHCSAPAVEGEPSALTGVVLSPDLSLHLGQQVERAAEEKAIELRRQQALAEIEVGRTKAYGEASLIAQTASTAAWRLRADVQGRRAEIAEQKLAEGPPFYRTFEFGVSVGVVVTVIITALVLGELHLAPN